MPPPEPVPIFLICIYSFFGSVDLLLTDSQRFLRSPANSHSWSRHSVSVIGDKYGFLGGGFGLRASPELAGKHPEPWQLEILQAIKDGLPLGKAVRLAVASGHGVGKTCLVSWILLWAISTREDTRGILTASNEAQLATRNRAELRKWFDLWKAREFFELTATALLHADAQSQQVWRIDLLPWNEHRPEAFAGLHNQGKPGYC
jgi:hypothetical protein